ncbi:MAG TPA: DUF6221 family protein [Candidatus Paceibacterota bacterium]
MKLVPWLRHRFDELEAVALAASQDRGSGTPSGEHWQWECGECDKVLAITDVVLLDEILFCPKCESGRVFLRSTEEYKTSSVGLLPHFVVSSAEEQRPVDALHIQTWSPARVVKFVESMRIVIALELDRAIDNGLSEPMLDSYESDTLQAVASIFDDHSEYRKEWRVEY